MTQARPSPLFALRYRDFRLLWTGLVFSNVGTWMQTFALGWYVVELAVREGVPERGPLYLGLIAGARAVPGLVTGVIAGTVSDRVDRRRLLMLVQVINGVIAGALAALALSDHLGLIPLFIATTLTGVASAFDSPARQAMLKGLVPSRAISSAVGLMLGTQNLATVLGPLIGGVLIGSVGVGGLLLLNALSYAVIVGAILAMGPVAFDRSAPRSNVLRSMQEGFAYVWSDPVIRPLFVLLIVTGLGGRSLTQLLPAFAHDTLHVGAVELSWLLGAAGLGALAGSMVTASLGGFRRRGLLAVVCAASFGALLLGFARQTALVPAVVLVALAATAMQLHITNHVTLYQLRTPLHLQGRVVGTSSTLSLTTASVGALLIGTLGTLAGINVAMGVGGAALLAAALFILARSAPLRDVGTERDQLFEPATVAALSE